MKKMLFVSFCALSISAHAQVYVGADGSVSVPGARVGADGSVSVHGAYVGADGSVSVDAHRPQAAPPVAQPGIEERYRYERARKNRVINEVAGEQQSVVVGNGVQVRNGKRHYMDD